MSSPLFQRLLNSPRDTASSIGLLCLRLGFGFTLLLAHGLGKLTQFERLSQVFPDPIGLGSTLSLVLALFAEVFCALFVAIGFFTRFFALVLVIQMSVIFFVVHRQDPFADSELSFLFLLAFLGMTFLGAGKFSVDEFLFRSQRR